jgi:hypothetical protein
MKIYRLATLIRLNVTIRGKKKFLFSLFCNSGSQPWRRLTLNFSFLFPPQQKMISPECNKSFLCQSCKLKWKGMLSAFFCRETKKWQKFAKINFRKNKKPNENLQTFLAKNKHQTWPPKILFLRGLFQVKDQGDQIGYLVGEFFLWVGSFRKISEVAQKLFPRKRLCVKFVNLTKNGFGQHFGWLFW